MGIAGNRRLKAALPTVVGVLVGQSAGTTPPALADHFSGATGSTATCTSTGGGGGDINMTDNNSWTWAYSALETATRDAFNRARPLYEASDLNISNPVIGAGDSQTDMVARDENYTTYCGVAWDASDNNVWGLATCLSLSGSKCQKHNIRIDYPDMSARPSLDAKTGLACHELGHTAGLRHRDRTGASTEGCMYKYASPEYLPRISAHDRSVLDDNY